VLVPKSLQRLLDAFRPCFSGRTFATFVASRSDGHARSRSVPGGWPPTGFEPFGDLLSHDVRDMVVGACDALHLLGPAGTRRATSETPSSTSPGGVTVSAIGDR
jgi:hypothetical protein